MRIAVAGGTGAIGRFVTGTAAEAGHDVVTIARSRGVDLLTGSGLDAALTGVDVVVDVSNRSALGEARAVAFFQAATGHLLAAEQRAGVAHHVVLSIVGIDRVHMGYYAGKRRQEELVEAGPVPWTILRATQFHEFAAQTLTNAVGPLVPVPRMLTQPVAAREVATELVRLAAAGPRGRATEMAGPQQRDLVTMVRDLVRARHLRRVVVPIRIPGSVGRALRDGGQLPSGPVTQGRITFSEWLSSADAEQIGAASIS
jgi:uncharacterized protein YbjT (DUF2867 family)